MRDVALVAFDGAQSMDVVGPLEVFATANFLLDRASKPVAYRTKLLALRKGPVTTSAGLRLLADESFTGVKEADTVFVAGGDTRSVAREPRLMNP